MHRIATWVIIFSFPHPSSRFEKMDANRPGNPVSLLRRRPDPVNVLLAIRARFFHMFKICPDVFHDQGMALLEPRAVTRAGSRFSPELRTLRG